MFKKIQLGKNADRAAGLALLLASVATLASPVQAADQEVTTRYNLGASKPQMTVVRDAQSGQIRGATPNEANLISQQNTRQSIPSPSTLQKWHASGAQGARLSDAFMSSSVAIRRPDGTLAEHCFDSHPDAEAAVKAVPGFGSFTAPAHETE